MNAKRREEREAAGTVVPISITEDKKDERERRFTP
jgi:hypothetical protein